MACKIRIKIGYVEIDYEGEETFFKEELPKMISEISHLVTKEPIGTFLKESTDSTIVTKSHKGDKKLDLSVADIAAKIGVKTGPELIIAAAANLSFVDKIESFSRDQIWDKMKTAPSFNRASYNNNLTKYLNKLVSDQQLRQSSADKFALSAPTILKLEGILAL